MKTIKKNLPVKLQYDKNVLWQVDVVFAGKEILYTSHFQRPRENKRREWFPTRTKILFEHENVIDRTYQEIYKLIYRKAPLKVVVTYCPKEEMQGQICKSTYLANLSKNII